MVALQIPAAELPELGDLKADVRAELNTWLDVLGEFAAADNKGAALVELRARYGHKIRISQGTLYRKLDRFRRQGWRGLVNKARQGRARCLLPPQFIDFWKLLCQQNQRKCAPAYRVLFGDWLLAGRPIPGYGTWSEIWRAEHPGWSVPDSPPYREHDNVPRGWTYRNLIRYAPDAFESTAARIGLGAASAYLPKIPTTRAGLHLGQFYVIDDVWHDHKVNFLGNTRAHRPLELGALELLSGHYCSWGVKAVREREDGTREMLKERYVRYLLAHLLCRVGIHPEGCTIMGEHGTARVDQAMLAACNRWGHSVTFEAGGLHGAPIAKGLYAGRPRGNFRFKGALESRHNLTHNELAALPGQVGLDRDHAPEEQYGRDAENAALVKATVALAEARPDLISQLDMPYMSYFSFLELLGGVYDRIANRIHHQLEGFEEAGLVIQEFRLGDGLPWMPAAELANYDAEQRVAIEAVIRRPGMTKLRAMSPIEAFSSRKHELVTLPDCACPDILGPDLGQVTAVSQDLEITVKDVEIPGRQHQFLAIITDHRGVEHPLGRGATYMVHVSPFDDRQAYITNAEDGRFLGLAPALRAACRTDVEAMQHNLGLRSHAIRTEVKRLAPLAEAKLRERAKQAEDNVTALLGRDPVAEAEAEADVAEFTAGAGGDVEDLLVGTGGDLPEDHADLSELL